MTTTTLWIPVLALGFLWILVAVAFAARRMRRARHGQILLLRRRGRIARVYHRLRDGRVYDPDRNPDVARVLNEEKDPSSPPLLTDTLIVEQTDRATSA